MSINEEWFARYTEARRKLDLVEMESLIRSGGWREEPVTPTEELLLSMAQTALRTSIEQHTSSVQTQALLETARNLSEGLIAVQMQPTGITSLQLSSIAESVSITIQSVTPGNVAPPLIVCEREGIQSRQKVLSISSPTMMRTNNETSRAVPKRQSLFPLVKNQLMQQTMTPAGQSVMRGNVEAKHGIAENTYNIMVTNSFVSTPEDPAEIQYRPCTEQQIAVTGAVTRNTLTRLQGAAQREMRIKDPYTQLPELKMPITISKDSAASIASKKVDMAIALGLRKPGKSPRESGDSLDNCEVNYII